MGFGRSSDIASPADLIIDFSHKKHNFSGISSGIAAMLDFRLLLTSFRLVRNRI
jgi:hypothetical protein